MSNDTTITTLNIRTGADEYLEILLASMYRNFHKYHKSNPPTKTHKSKKKCRRIIKLEGSKELELWLNKNLDNPYPSKEQVDTFIESTGLTITQIKNWFSNARRRWPELRHKNLLRIKRAETKKTTKRHMTRFNRPMLI